VNFTPGSGPKATVVGIGVRADMDARGDAAFLLVTPSSLEADHRVVPVPRRSEVEDVLNEPELLVGVVPRTEELEELGGRGVLHGLTIPLSTATLHSGGERLNESLVGVWTEGHAEQVVEVLLVDRDPFDVEVQVTEGGVTHGGPPFAAELDLLCIPGELFAEGLGVADDVGCEPIDGAGGGEELDVSWVPLLGVGGDEGHESRFVFAVVHDLSIPLSTATLHRVHRISRVSFRPTSLQLPSLRARNCHRRPS